MAAGKSGVSMSIVPLLSTNNVPAPRATMSLVLVPSSKFTRRAATFLLEKKVYNNQTANALITVSKPVRSAFVGSKISL